MNWGHALIAFFGIFAVASILIPLPVFPGSWFCGVIGEPVQEHVWFLSAVVNGAFYGGILWLTLFGLGKKLERQVS